MVYGNCHHVARHIMSSFRDFQFFTLVASDSGLAVVTSDVALLYTDGRYFLQAEQQLDCNWQLMKVDGKNRNIMLTWL